MLPIPVIVVNGFLESGKTFFINEGLLVDAFALESRTLILACEEGEEKFDTDLLEKNNIKVHFLESEEEFNEENLKRIVDLYNPNLIIIEMNGMWDLKNLRMPDFFGVEEQATVIDSNTFNMYFTNMRERFVDMIKYSTLIVINRCADEKNAAAIKRSLKLINQVAGYILLDNDNNEMHPADDLPFDVKAETIIIPDDAYGIWYIDTFDSPDRYRGKNVEFNAMIIYSHKLPARSFVAGRVAMTCCEADKRFIGHLCKARVNPTLKDKSWARIKAKIHYARPDDYSPEQAVLEIIEINQIKEIENPEISLM
ncbi:MAG TPA: GTP-binding protein [Clostridia bacterium]|jgi:hypothetical protein|nr:GTP-binding protein [Clostridia bacterium]